MTRWRAVALVVVVVGALAAIALVWQFVGVSCYDPTDACGAITTPQLLIAGLIAACAVGLSAAILSRTE